MTSHRPGFKDHFSTRAAGYAQARPTYPASLFAALAEACTGRTLAWDCGTGNGQAALGLADHFATVIATDPSTPQLSRARAHPRITYRRGRESESGLAPGAVDLVTAAQAAHWFDLGAFYGEVRRVLRPRGVVAIWTYSICHISPEIDHLLDEFYRHTVGPYWPPERRHVESGYRSLPFPFDQLPFPDLVMEHAWALPELAAFLGTWSAVTRYSDAHGNDPVGPFLERLAPLWGAPQQRRRVTWPLAGRLGRL
jgi:SAM-dependent methyltransferase